MLPFDLALVRSIAPTGIVEVPAPAEHAADSWFPDYSWDHWIVCASVADKPQHLGWRFTRKPGAVGPGPATFVALIVAAKDKEAGAEAAHAAAGTAMPPPLAAAASQHAPIKVMPAPEKTPPAPQQIKATLDRGSDGIEVVDL